MISELTSKKSTASVRVETQQGQCKAKQATAADHRLCSGTPLDADDVAPVDGERGERGRGPYGASRGDGERGVSRALDVVQAARGRVHVGAARCDASGF